MKILGEGDPEGVYERLDAQKWIEEVNRQLENSALPEAARRISTEVVARGRQQILYFEGLFLIGRINNAMADQRCGEFFVRSRYFSMNLQEDLARSEEIRRRSPECIKAL